VQRDRSVQPETGKLLPFMSRHIVAKSLGALARMLGRLAHDRSGNTLVIIAAAVVPMLGLVGGGIDMGRSYLAQTRLQQACDAGVLAARKKVGSQIITNGIIPTDASTIGQRFFDLNFADGAYGSTDRTFAMNLESNYAVTGAATASVPTTIMRMFGVATIPVKANCSAQFNYANTDIMMVLDTTGSMKDKAVSTDAKNKIDTLKQTVKDFYASVEANKTQGVRVRYGFVPYSTNVNVGYLLKSSWMVDSANYEGRRAVTTNGSTKWRYESTSVNVSGLKGASDTATYKGGYVTRAMGGTAASPLNMSFSFNGCIEERGTYVIPDYNNVDLTRALDLDIDTVPDKTKPATQWRPALLDMSWLRAIYVNYNNFYGYWSPASVDSNTEYVQSSDYGFAACPARARKLAEMTSSDVSTYIDGLVAEGSTYHDIGMIWGGRLLSPTGIFASENADVNNRPTMRHLIFLTDGETAPLDLSYSSYGVEPLSQRRWNSSSPYTLTQTVENRFAYACQQVRNKNITVWMIGFGTTVTTLMKNCAGSGHWFQANKASELADAFSKIAAAIGDLRVVK